MAGKGGKSMGELKDGHAAPSSTPQNVRMGAQASVNDLAYAIILYERLEDHLQAMAAGDDLKDIVRQFAQQGLKKVRCGDLDALAGLKKAVQGLDDRNIRSKE